MKQSQDAGQTSDLAGSPKPGRSLSRSQPAKIAISRRAFLRMAGLTAAGVALAACVPRSSTGAGPHGSDSAQLVYQDWRTEWFSAMAQRMLDQFHASHPNIHVFFTEDPEDLAGGMEVDFQENTAPDVVDGCCDFFPEWAQKGYLLDLRPYVKADLDRETVTDWDPVQYNALFTRKGVQYGLPKYHGALALFYNKDLFDKYRVDYPDGRWNHDDYLEAMKRLTKDRDGDGKTDLWGSIVDISWERIQVHVNGWGGHFVDPTNSSRSMIGRQEAVDAMRWIRDRMWQDHVMASRLDVQNLVTSQAFIQERVAMVEDGSWALKDILEGARFRIGVATFPAGPARKVTLATTDGFGIFAGTKYPDAAWELLRFLTGSDYGRAMAQAHLLQPARASLVQEWTSFIQKQYPDKSRDMDIDAFAEGHLQGYSVVAEIFTNMAEARRLVGPAWQEVFTLGRAPVEVMLGLSEQIEQAQTNAA